MSSPLDSKVAEQSLEHARNGYQNAQDVIKFMDTKFGAIIGLSVILCGFILQSLASFLQLPESTQAGVRMLMEKHAAETRFLSLCVALSLLCGIGCIVSAVSGVMARAPRGTSRWLKILASIGIISHLPKRKKYKHTVLFPFWTDSNKAVRSFCRISRGLSHKEISEEYVSQLWNVGAILKKKIAWVRWATRAFIAQTIFLVAAAFCLGSVMYASYGQQKAVSPADTLHGQPLVRDSMNPMPSATSSFPPGAQPDASIASNAYSVSTTSSQTRLPTPDRRPQQP